MSYAYVRGAHGDGSGAGGGTVAYPANVAAGDLLLAVVFGYQPSVTTPTMSVSDTQGNTWTRAGAIQQDSNSLCALFYAVAKSSAACSVTSTSNGTSAWMLVVAEFSGGASAVDGAETGNASAFSVASFTPTAGDLLISCVTDNNATETMTPPSGLTSNTALTYSNGNSTSNIALSYALSAAGSATTLTWTVSGGSTLPGSVYAVFTTGGGASDPFPVGYTTLIAQLGNNPLYRM